MKYFAYIFVFSCMHCLSVLAQCGNFAGADYSQGIVFIMENNKIVWQHEAPESNDLWVLPNGNLLFSIGKGVLEVTRQMIPFSLRLSKPHLCLPASEKRQYVYR